VVSLGQRGPHPATLAAPGAVSVRRAGKSEARVDIALLASALFLQRFSLPFGKTYLALDFVPVVLILSYQFLSGKLVLQYDRFYWFLAVGLVAACSLYLNFKSTMLTSFGLFMLLYSLPILIRPSTPDQYERTLQSFQFLVILLSCLAVLQFAAQFVVDGRKLIMFYGIIPDFLLGAFNAGGMNTIHPIEGAPNLLKSNGLFLAEPSNLSQVVALGILIEILEFRRPKYLVAMVPGFLLAYSGTGLMILLVFLPLAGISQGKAGLSVLLVAVFALGLFATGIVDFSVFHSRTAEFQETHASGFERFVSPLWLTGKFFETGPLRALLFGSGSGTVKYFTDTWYGGFAESWFKLLYEYGVIGLFIFLCFLAVCVSKSRCPGLVLAALLSTYIFIEGFLSTWFVTIVIVLCTLHGPELRRSRLVGPRRPEPSFVAGPAASRL
jgi:hypothetical protein